MGNLLGRHQNPVDELEHIVKKLQSYEVRTQNLTATRYNVMWYFTVLILFLVSVYSAIACLDASDTKQIYQKLALTWFSGVLLFFVFRFTIWKSFDFLLRRTQKNIEVLNNRRTEIIEKVKETERFKVAKEIIEKFGSAEDLAEIGVGVKQPTPPPASKVNIKPNAPSLPPADPVQNPEPSFVVPQNPDVTYAGEITDVSLLRTPMMPPRFGQMQMRTPRQPARPFVPVSRTPIDKIIDYIIGDGPSNRFALICKQCHAHNGMALREEFEGISFVCYNCGFFNPAKNAEPLRTPRRPNNATFALEERKPFIRTATNTDSSDNDDGDKPEPIVSTDTEQ